MKTKTLIIILMLLSASEVLAQSRIWEMPTTPADTTIVREWREGKYIVYSRQGSNQTVSYHDNLSPTIRSAQIPPFVIINDFCIFGDMVYAGGKIPGTPFSHGLLASFSIHDLMGASGTFYVMTFIINNIGYSTCQDYTFPDCHVSGIKRIFPFQSGSATCVAYIADDSIVGSGSSGIGCRRVGYGDALFSGLAWSIDTFHYNKDAFNLFSDLTATDNYIALVSRDCYYNRLEFVVHDKGANYANLPPTPGSDIYFFTDHKVTGKVMSTALEEDIFAVAYHYDVPSQDDGLAVKVFKISAGVPLLLYSLEFPPATASSSTCEMRDIRYDSSSKELWILNDITNSTSGTFGSYLYRIDMANFYAGTYEARYISGYRFHSLDDLRNGGYTLSGTKTGMLGVHVEQNPSASVLCTNVEIVKGIKTTPTMQRYQRSICTFSPEVSTQSYPFTVYDSPATIICNH